MMAYRHRGFWHPADTVKERTVLEALRAVTGVGPLGVPDTMEVVEFSAPTGTLAAISIASSDATCCCGRASASSTRRSAAR